MFINAYDIYFMYVYDMNMIYMYMIYILTPG